jgi:hypothetical protein
MGDDNAATKIQAGVRGHETRVDIGKESGAATSVQAKYRGDKSRGTFDAEDPNAFNAKKEWKKAITGQSFFV